MNRSRMLLMVLGGFLFGMIVVGQIYFHSKKEGEMRKYFSLILNDKKSLENHVQHLANREKILLDRLNQAEAKIKNLTR